MKLSSIVALVFSLIQEWNSSDSTSVAGRHCYVSAMVLRPPSLDWICTTTRPCNIMVHSVPLGISGFNRLQHRMDSTDNDYYDEEDEERLKHGAYVESGKNSNVRQLLQSKFYPLESTMMGITDDRRPRRIPTSSNALSIQDGTNTIDSYSSYRPPVPSNDWGVERKKAAATAASSSLTRSIQENDLLDLSCAPAFPSTAVDLTQMALEAITASWAEEHQSTSSTKGIPKSRKGNTGCDETIPRLHLDPNIVHNAMYGDGNFPIYGRRPVRSMHDMGRIGIEISGAACLFDRNVISGWFSDGTVDVHSTMAISEICAIRLISLMLAEKLTRKKQQYELVQTASARDTVHASARTSRHKPSKLIGKQTRRVAVFMSLCIVWDWTTICDKSFLFLPTRMTKLVTLTIPQRIEPEKVGQRRNAVIAAW
jgi:hypothetical protein